LKAGKGRLLRLLKKKVDGGFIRDVYTYAGDPSDTITPRRIGDICIDTVNNDVYIATSASTSGWTQMIEAEQ